MDFGNFKIKKTRRRNNEYRLDMIVDVRVSLCKYNVLLLCILTWRVDICTGVV
jgi:hypothetical protein